MKTTFHYFCAPKKPTAEYEAEDIVLTLSLPFVPHPGMDLKLTQEGDFHRVDGVMWDASEPDELSVFLEEPAEGEELRPWPEMKAMGWKLS